MKLSTLAIYYIVGATLTACGVKTVPLSTEQQEAQLKAKVVQTENTCRTQVVTQYLYRNEKTGEVTTKTDKYATNN